MLIISFEYSWLHRYYAALNGRRNAATLIIEDTRPEIKAVVGRIKIVILATTKVIDFSTVKHTENRAFLPKKIDLLPLG